ncbi:NAD-dependent epimerase/dehydratase family protein [Nonomuraea phyllanthi]|uniref:NAD-dependent epimerase/dehydratase family protein n=1 Tax=Nonomuraea phyllanthi TaxID=2219224 RepID=A0A5C4WIJ9_9ACTN|nr:NAD-dependent epimerase/dehydratase family protein [Nonomuraea phyllanthi]KAB8194128.1 NAD-dependent epimerase/dehydratase family protein [Nonomuraea phyllanthi]QFY07730.1 NAD-dependent epimerase/dehydratase family protein [Nonomuraea phyllanthi]
MARRIVVTGSAGMLGGNLARRLVLDGHDVLGVDLRPQADPLLAAGHRIADVRDLPLMTEAMSGADAVVHCAGALPSYPAEQIHDLIVGGTGTVLEAGRRAGVERLVHISSTAVYGLPTLVPTPEDHPRAPVDPYTRAKAAAEELAEKYRADGMRVPILRPKTFLGPGRMGLFAMLFEWAEEGRNFPVLGRGDKRIQMFAIEDLLDAVAIVLDAPADLADDTYNLAAAEFGTLREDFQAVLDAAGHGKRVVSLPAGPALAGLRLLERSRLSPVYGRLALKLLADSYVSIDKARERLGFRPRLSNQDAILRTYAWWREQRAAGSAAGSARGATSRDAWRQGALSLAKIFF